MTHVAFLGIADRATSKSIGGPFRSLSVMGLRSVVASYIYPLPLGDWKLVLAIEDIAEFGERTLRLLGPNGDELFTSTMRFEFHAAPPPPTVPPPQPSSPTARPPLRVDFAVGVKGSWMIAANHIQGIDVTVREPGVYSVVLSRAGGEEVEIGALYFEYVQRAKPSLEEIAAMRSDPRTPRAVMVDIKSQDGKLLCRAYAALERDRAQEAQEGWVWYEDLPDEVESSSGAEPTNLRYIKENLHAVLTPDSPLRRSGGFSFLKEYELHGLKDRLGEFERLLDSRPVEQQLQAFLEANPIFFHRFTPARLMGKRPILSERRTDFTILTDKKDLLLVEIERSNLPLVRKTDGGKTADLQHAFTQVEQWLQITADHRVAVLRGLGLELSDVGSIKGVVIAGRDGNVAPEHLRRIKGQSETITFLTYDDLANGLRSLLDSLEDV